MTYLRTLLPAGAATLVLMTGVQAADHIPSGAISTASGQKMEGVTVYAKMEGSTVTTSVYTDESGGYYSRRCRLEARVWAQAGFETARGTVDLTSKRRHDLVLQTMTDAERPADAERNAGERTAGEHSDARMKKIFMNNCTGCHPPGYLLQFRFDEAGWNKVINLMKVVPGTGVYPGPDARANEIMSRNQKELAVPARARGPGETAMKFTPRPRPTGEAARAVWKSTFRSIQTRASGQSTTTTTVWIGRSGRRRSSASFRTTAAWDSTATSYHGEQPQSSRHDRQGRRQDRNGFVSQGGRAKRRGGHRSRPDARRARELLVRRESGSPRPRQARPEDRQDHRVSNPLGHDARRWRRDDGRRRPGKDLGIIT